MSDIRFLRAPRGRILRVKRGINGAIFCING